VKKSPTTNKVALLKAIISLELVNDGDEGDMGGGGAQLELEQNGGEKGEAG
jgi:hypothetical protein